MLDMKGKVPVPGARKCGKTAVYHMGLSYDNVCRNNSYEFCVFNVKGPLSS